MMFDIQGFRCFGVQTQSGIARPRGPSIFNFLRTGQLSLHSSCPTLRPRPQLGRQPGPAGVKPGRARHAQGCRGTESLWPWGAHMEGGISYPRLLSPSARPGHEIPHSGSQTSPLPDLETRSRRSWSGQAAPSRGLPAGRVDSPLPPVSALGAWL